MARRKQQRTALLLRLYEAVDGSVSVFVDAFELGAELGIERGERRRHLEYLHEKGWVLVDDFRSGTARLTAAGVDEVERGLDA